MDLNGPLLSILFLQQIAFLSLFLIAFESNRTVHQVAGRFAEVSTAFEWISRPRITF